jgi:putative acetyltransferase
MGPGTKAFHSPVIREETPEDATAVRRVNVQAFIGETEARLVEQLHNAKAVTLSLVAEVEGEIVGHLMFSPVTINGTVPAVGLGPMAVLPTNQGQGIGTLLVREGLEQLERLGHTAVVVVGHADYYPRFGFVPARLFALACEFEVPEESFMALELRAGALARRAGVVRYRPEFAEGETAD